MARYYIASCVFTSRFPDLSIRICNYVEKRFGLKIIRCCVPKYKLREFTEKMPEGTFRERWAALPDCAPFQTDDEVYSLCHNCSNIIERRIRVCMSSPCGSCWIPTNSFCIRTIPE